MLRHARRHLRLLARLVANLLRLPHPTLFWLILLHHAILTIFYYFVEYLNVRSLVYPLGRSKTFCQKSLVYPLGRSKTFRKKSLDNKA